MNKKIIWSIVAVAVVAIAGWWYYNSVNSTSQQPYTPPTNNASSTLPPVSPLSTSTPPVARPGERCGGNMVNAPICTSGYYCAPNPNSHLPFGDVGGTCMPSGGKG